MYTFTNKKYYINVLLFTLLWTSFTWATSEKSATKHNKFSWKNTRINFSTGAGWPYGPIYTIFKIGNDEEAGISVYNQPNTNLEALAVYTLGSMRPKTNKNTKISLNLETGIIYPFPRPVKVRKFGIVFTEQRIKFPLYLNICWDVSSYFKYSWILGYELDYALSSQYYQSGYYTDLPNSMRENKNVKKFLPEVPVFWNNIVSTMHFGFPKGIYIQIKGTITPMFLKFTTQQYYDKRHELDTMFVTLMRGLTSTSLELRVGVNIMEWFFTKEEL